ncbi:MAG: tetratricopeptide repeat protein [Prevotellaceae bacterium]|jgi:tetratricopeptide (TPR) repeat protein|nr:tetratricopeptide repeat protein [Prevotellaceae bacterium]
MKKYIIILSIILASVNNFAQDTDSLLMDQNMQTESVRQKYTNADSMFDAANKLYNEGKFEDAADMYEAVLDAGRESSYLYYNLGNVYFKQNALAAAILNYERAYRLNPSDEDVNHNLAIARSQVTDKFNEIPEFFVLTIFGKIKSLFAANTWGLIALLSFTAVLVLVLLFLFAGRLFVRRLSFWLACVVLILSISCKLIENSLRKYDSAIVFVPVLTAKTSPDDSGKDMFLLHEGTKVLVRDSFSEWTKIQLPNGEQGWVASEAITVI